VNAIGCNDCHTNPQYIGNPFAGGPIVFNAAGYMGGGRSFGPGVVSRNITPDIKTGIGRYTDPEIARLLRYGVHPTGRAMLPFMPFSDLSDEDLVAVISYLRSRPPIDHAVPDHAPNTLGRIAKAFVLEPRGPTQPIRARVAIEPTAQYGEYLAKTVANCSGCHTRRSLKTGEATGVELAGGMELDSHAAPGTKFTTPNLTPDPKTGQITAWTEEQFIARFKNGTDTASPMPWGTFRNMTDDDLRALYRYLRTLPPATVGQDL
jgi:mono/diheme cytochrome c family protein